MDQGSIRSEFARAYASGALSPALALMVEAQAALVPAQAQAVAAAENAAAALFEQSGAISLRPGALAAMMARIDALAQDEAAPSPAAPPASGLMAELAALPEPVRRAAAEAEARGESWRTAAPGLRTLRLMEADGTETELLRIQPGHGAPAHTHSGGEYTLVLQGAFHDGHALYGVGDISYADPDLTHRPIAEPGPICYALAVTEGPLAFKGVLGALQRLTKH